MIKSSREILRMRCLLQAGSLHKKLSFSIASVMTAVILGCSSTPSGNATNVTIKDSLWLINGKPVLKDSPAEGLLVNVRMVNAVFEDSGPLAKSHLPKDFDPDENTTRFIAQIQDYYAHGVRAFTISLQGGLPGYEGAVNSAFNRDGSLRRSYLDRVERVIHAADQEGVVIILSCFYQRQHSHEYSLDGKQTILNAVANVTQWIVNQKFTNVVLEISNEYAHGGYNKWKDGEWLKSVDGQVELIRHAKNLAPNLLVSTSGMGSGLSTEPLARAADFIVIHFNRTPLSLIPERVMHARSFGKPVVCNEDDKIGKLGAEAARVSIKSGAGWGFMHIEKNQTAPFEFDGVADDTLVYRMLARLTTPGESIDGIPAEQFSALITNPIDGDVFVPGNAISIRAVVTGIENTDGIEVRFFAEDKLIGKDTSAPWEITWENAPTGKYNVLAVVHGSKGEELLRSGMVDFEVTP
ncbi:MAG: Ig-like domain-containing protein [Cyclobacteriaceae bacterium]